MYCQINPKLFKEFTSRKKKITPALSDDWEILPESYNSNSDITYYSEKLKQKISGCNVFTLLYLLRTYNAEIEGLKLKGEWIIGQDRKLYSKEDYEKWIRKYGSMVESKMSLKDITYEKRGRKYQFKCGAEYYFLGFLKDKKGKKVRLFGNYDNDLDYLFFKIVSSAKDISKELNESISEEKISRFYTEFLFDSSYNPGEVELVKFYDKDKGEVVKGFISQKKGYRTNRDFTFKAFDEKGNTIKDFNEFYPRFPEMFIGLEAKFENGFIYTRNTLEKRNWSYSSMRKSDPDRLKSILDRYEFVKWKKYDKDLYFKRVKSYIK